MQFSLISSRQLLAILLQASLRNVLTADASFLILFLRAYNATFLCSSWRSLIFCRMLPTSNCMLRIKETSITKARMKLSKTSLPFFSKYIVQNYQRSRIIWLCSMVSSIIPSTSPSSRYSLLCFSIEISLYFSAQVRFCQSLISPMRELSLTSCTITSRSVSFSRMVRFSCIQSALPPGSSPDTSPSSGRRTAPVPPNPPPSLTAWPSAEMPVSTGHSLRQARSGSDKPPARRTGMP